MSSDQTGPGSGLFPYGEDEDLPAGPVPPARTHSRRRSSSNRRRWVLIVGGAFLLVVLGLVILAIPLLGVRSDANAARADLTVAMTALRKGDLNTAEVRVSSARAHITKAKSGADGVGASVWGAVPVAGSAVHDMRYLVTALDDATSIAELGVDLYPAVLGSDATLIHDDTVDFPTLTKVDAAARKVGTYLASATAALDKVSGSAPIVGGSISSARDAAATQVASLQGTYNRVEPILGILPKILGSGEDMSYLIAVMNPSELRYSGGATLTLATMDFKSGVATFGESGATTDFTDNNELTSWTPVEGNPFYRGGQTPLVNATFSPYWTASGEELLRAWQATSGQNCDALIAIDLQTIASLFTITGPIDVPGYGKLTAANFVETLAGSYDKFDDADKRKEINSAIIPAFREKLFSGGKFVQKAQVLLGAADGRDFVTYFRDPAVQSVFAGLGLGGDLSDTTHDYIGVFTQNTNASKVDFWQHRTVESDVTLAADGSAEVQLTVTINNETPPYTRPLEDPHRGYFTRWSAPAIGVFLPTGATVTAASLGDTALTPNLVPIANRAFFQQPMTIEPNGTGVLKVTYKVPAAALLTTSGQMTYALAVDPQGLVNPEAMKITVHFPPGYTVGSLPEGWHDAGAGSITYTSDGLKTSPRWEISAEPK